MLTVNKSKFFHLLPQLGFFTPSESHEELKVRLEHIKMHIKKKSLRTFSKICLGMSQTVHISATLKPLVVLLCQNINLGFFSVLSLGQKCSNSRITLSLDRGRYLFF